MSHGVLSDNCNPVTKKLALSEPVYASDFIAAVGVATQGGGACYPAHAALRAALGALGYGAMAIGSKLFL